VEINGTGPSLAFNICALQTRRVSTLVIYIREGFLTGYFYYKINDIYFISLSSLIPPPPYIMIKVFHSLHLLLNSKFNFVLIFFFIT
jgi:hypothetical protein